MQYRTGVGCYAKWIQVGHLINSEQSVTNEKQIERKVLLSILCWPLWKLPKWNFASNAGAHLNLKCVEVANRIGLLIRWMGRPRVMGKQRAVAGSFVWATNEGFDKVEMPTNCQLVVCVWIPLLPFNLVRLPCCRRSPSVYWSHMFNTHTQHHANSCSLGRKLFHITFAFVVNKSPLGGWRWAPQFELLGLKSKKGRLRATYGFHAWTSIHFRCEYFQDEWSVLLEALQGYFPTNIFIKSGKWKFLM